MTRFHAEVRVTPRAGLLDPEGKAVHHALDSLGYEGVEGVRVGKVVVLELEASSEDTARARIEEMCRRLLANPVTENFQIELSEETSGDAGE